MSQQLWGRSLLITGLILIYTWQGVLYAAETTPEKRKKWASTPVIASSPETGLILGGMLFYFLHDASHQNNTSTIDIIGFGTTKGQYLFRVSPDMYFSQNQYHLNTELSADFWKANFYGIGNNSPDNPEEYESTTLGIFISLERSFLDNFSFGPALIYKNESMDTKPGGVLSTGNVKGSVNGTYTGLGFGIGYDTRDNGNAPLSGDFVRYEYLNFYKAIGSDYDFRIQKLDLRHYFPLSKKRTLAFAGHYSSSRGDVPFRYLSSPDGSDVLRGIENGRYLDRDLLAVQSEFRFPIKNKFSGSIFFELAQVADSLNKMQINDFKSSAGAGFRYSLNQEERLNLRFDFSWVDSGFGLIVNVREAF